MDLLDIEDINNSLDLELEKNKLTREELINICEQSVVKLPMQHMPKFSRIHEKRTNFRKRLQSQ